MAALITVRSTCRLCGSPRIVLSIPLAGVPIVSPNVGTETGEDDERLTRIVAPLDSYLCQDCGLLQLVHVVDPSLIYRNYLYRTSISLGLPKHFRELSEVVIARAKLKSNDLVVEFGSNDGTLLSCFREGGMRVQGVDPARDIAAQATGHGIPTTNDFFNNKVARNICDKAGKARVVIANNSMANIDNLTEIFEGIKTIMAEDGVFIFETQYALDVFENTLLDVIYHEHISTFSVRPVVRALTEHGLSVFDAERISTKGGSIRFWVQHTGGMQPASTRLEELMELEERAGLYDLAEHKKFGERVSQIKAQLHGLIGEARTSGRLVGAYGVSVGCAALIHQLELGDKLDVLFDDTPFKRRLDGPGYDLPILGAEAVLECKPGLIIILAWRYAEPISRKHAKYLEQGGRFVVPLPNISILP